MFKEITLGTRGLIAIARTALEHGGESSDESVCSFFDEYEQLDSRLDAIIVDMQDDGSGAEMLFDGDYFCSPHAIRGFLGHDDATHILLQTPKHVFVYFLQEDEDMKIVVL
ncbi:hypothetical protein [Vibrio owensii]|uniref:hypothetical protein n=1 Tax=Vibrio owensii TaxID=696485 RepID=UPI0018F13915|nr:hypothetical protein [Vibrio owensii]